MQKILLDANFMLIPAQFNVDIFEELKSIMNEPYELFTIDMVIDELHNLTKTQSGKDKLAAKIGLQLLEQKHVDILKTEKNLKTDKMIVEIAKKLDCLVATQDKGLKQLLKENNVKLVILRQKKHLCLK